MLHLSIIEAAIDQKNIGTVDIEDLEDNCRLRRATFINYKVPNIGQEGSGHCGRLRRALTTSIKKPKIDQEDFTEDIPDGAVIKVKVKAG